MDNAEYLALAESHVAAAGRLLEPAPRIKDREARAAAMELLTVSAKVFSAVFHEESRQLRLQREADHTHQEPI